MLDKVGNVVTVNQLSLMCKSVITLHLKMFITFGSGQKGKPLPLEPDDHCNLLCSSGCPTGVNLISLFFFVTDSGAKYVHGKLFQPSPLFWSKVGACPDEH